MSEKLDWLCNFTIFHAFDPGKIADGSVNVAPLSFGLAVSAIILFGLATIIFKRKDLPI
ncbi:hypothetical protein MK805_12745 [Shimazuella sp. AN120528]|uniref:hypothetical protein n=1 Tax=Shimazuella soli TaxID=1892854 RepID=UPI001F0E7290|nr:hypothetical protein [Shimazuella soli]MCH5585810.1 hypothetical protein [Shimazuella soli]